MKDYFVRTKVPIMRYMSSTEVKVLIVDDDADLRAALTDFISRMGAKVRSAGNVAEAQQMLQTETTPFEIVITDLKIPGGSGMDVLKAAHARSLESLITIITGYASMETAIDAIRLGAYSYIAKPFSLNEIGVQVRNMIERVTLSKENARLSIKLQELYEQIERFQTERADAFKLHEDINKKLLENTQKLDQILTLVRPNGTQWIANRIENAAIPKLSQANEGFENAKPFGSIPQL
jgi:DNA-binding NtrC family response regulator